MAKRFIDTGLFDDEWFMDLSKDAKIMWMYVITKCDHAGLVHLNYKLCAVQTGIKDLNLIIKQLGNRIVTVKEQLLFIPKFIEFQYPGFPNSKVKQQASAVELLVKYNLFDREKQTLTQELTNSYVYVNDNDIEHGNEKPKKTKNILFVESPLYEFTTFNKEMTEYSKGKYKEADMNYYYEAVKNWSVSHDKRMVDWMATAANFMLKDIRENKFKKVKL